MSNESSDDTNFLLRMVEENERVSPEKINGLQENGVNELQSASDDLLVSTARESKANAFAPYSEFQVGASLKTEQGVYTGANIEISGRSTSIHAEMLAAYKAVHDGAQEFQVMAISAGDDPSGDIAPCGLCQHTLSQFTEELRILEDAGTDDPMEYWLSDLIGNGYSASTRHFEQVRDTE